MAEATDVGLVLEHPPGDGSFVDHALVARDALGAGAGRVGVAVGPGTVPPAGWRAVLAHGAGLRQVAEDWSRAGLGVVLTDWPEGELVPGMGYVDWAWWQAAYAVGYAAALDGFESFAVVAGPAVATQRRLVAAAAQGFADAGGTTPVRTWHLGSFQDLAGAVQAAVRLGDGRGGLVLTSAGAAAEPFADLALAAGWHVAGFGSRGRAWRYRIASDVAGGVQRLLQDLLDGAPRPGLVRLGTGSGLLHVATGPAADRAAETALAEALTRSAPLPAV